MQLQGAGAILGGNCGNCRSQVSPGAPSNPSQLYSPAPSSNKSSVTKAVLNLCLLTTSDDSLWQLTKTTEISGCRHFSCQQPVWVQFDRFDDSFRRITDKCQIGQEWAFLKRSLQAANPEVTNREILWVCGKIVVSCGQQQFTEWRTGGN